MRNSLKLAAVLIAVTATSASAQGRGRNTNGVPPGMRPPAGMCRVWINGVPAGQQPGVTDCVSAKLNVPANGRVIYGSGVSANTTARTYSRKRQLADGSWVLERVRRDANGTLTVVSSRPINRNANGTWNNKRGDDNEANDDSKSERKADKKDWKNEKKEDKRDNKGNKKDHDEESDDNS